MARSAGTRSSSIDGKKKPFTEAFDARPERDDRHPVALRRLDHRRDPIQMSAVDQRSAIRPVDAGTGAQGLEALFQQIHHLSVNRALGQHPAAGSTSLAGVLHDGIDHHRQRGVEVGVGKQDLRRFAAEFKRHRHVVYGGCLRHDRATKDLRRVVP